MTAPNLLNTIAVTGKTAGLVVTTAAQAIVTNSSNSAKVLKINSLYISNVNGVNSADITVDIYKNGATAYRMGYLIPIPAKATLTMISKDIAVYLEENDSLRITSSINTYIEAICSYEELS